MYKSLRYLFPSWLGCLITSEVVEYCLQNHLTFIEPPFVQSFVNEYFRGMCIMYFLWVCNLQHCQYLARHGGASSEAQTYNSLIPFTLWVIFFLVEHSIVIKWRKVHTVATLRTCILKEDTIILAFLKHFQTTESQTLKRLWYMNSHC